tara:strand:- start:1134 stop:1802 length:669 start_codon:yes stop_codon:yes gene_type:complete
MNKSFVKLLQSCAGVLLLSTAGFSMAATYDYDFDVDENERGGQPLNFGDLNVKGYHNGANYDAGEAYLDAGYLSGLGVCKGPVASGTTGTNNKCNTPGTGASDDNLQVGEMLEFVFDTAKQIEVGINGPHTSANGANVLIWTDAGNWDLLTVVAGKITLGVQHIGLMTLKIFGQGDFGQKEGRTTTNLYVAGINEVPLPAAVWLFGSALLGLAGLRRRKLAA